MCGSLCARRMIVLFGPTAVGKTAASLSVAKWSSAEIINMDVVMCEESCVVFHEIMRINTNGVISMRLSSGQD